MIVAFIAMMDQQAHRRERNETLRQVAYQKEALVERVKSFNLTNLHSCMA